MNYSKNNAIALEGDYSYTGRDGSCKDSSIAGVVSSSSATQIEAHNVDALKAAIEQGPISVTVEADTATFQGYQGGVINSDACGRSLDHAITAIGWGSDDKQDYYIVRNSWGAEWGDAGYLKIAAGGDYCGIENISVFPTIA